MYKWIALVGDLSVKFIILGKDSQVTVINVSTMVIQYKTWDHSYVYKYTQHCRWGMQYKNKGQNTATELNTNLYVCSLKHLG